MHDICCCMAVTSQLWTSQRQKTALSRRHLYGCGATHLPRRVIHHHNFALARARGGKGLRAQRQVMVAFCLRVFLFGQRGRGVICQAGGHFNLTRISQSPNRRFIIFTTSPQPLIHSESSHAYPASSILSTTLHTPHIAYLITTTRASFQASQPDKQCTRTIEHDCLSLIFV